MKDDQKEPTGAREKVKVIVYGLTTCPFCKRAVNLLENLNVEFETIYLDELDGEERNETLKKIYGISGMLSVPLIVAGDQYVVGYDENAIRKLVEKLSDKDVA